MLQRIALGSFVAFLFMAGTLPNSFAADTWRIGMVVPMSGPAATVGARFKNVAEWWAAKVNQAGGIRGKQIELVVCNDEANPAKAVACTRELLGKQIHLMFGNSLTASVRAMESLIAKTGPVMLVPSPNITPKADSYVFQTSPTDHDLTLALVKFLLANGMDSFGMVAATDASGEVGVQSAQQIAADSKVKLVLTRIDLRATDASTQLATLANQDLPVIYSSYSGRGAATVVKSYFNLGLTRPLIVSYANVSSLFVREIKDVVPPRLLGTTIAAIVPNSHADLNERRRAAEFTLDYEKDTGDSVDALSLLAKIQADIATAILSNVENPADPKAIKTFLETSGKIESVQDVTFSPTSHVGLNYTDVLIVELKNGKWVEAASVK